MAEDVTSAIAQHLSLREFRRLVAPHIKDPPPPPPVSEFYDRLNYGAGHPCLFLPHIGEFGHLIMTHVRLVHFHGASRKIVCCRPGDEVLFPAADEFVTDWTDPTDDAIRAGSMRSTPEMWPNITSAWRDCTVIEAGCLHPEHELLIWWKGHRVPFRPTLRGLRVDVALGARERRFHTRKNWPHWQAVADRIREAGFRFAVIGKRESSAAIHGAELYSGDLDTDAAVELLQNCRLYVGTDSGTAHLAAEVGADMMVIREEFFGRDFIPHMEAVNPGRVERMQGYWNDPEAVASRIMERLA